MTKRKFEYKDNVMITVGIYKGFSAVFKGYDRDRHGYSNGYVTVDIPMGDSIFKTHINPQYLTKV